mgnify:CR=1 FL=1
MLFRHFLFCVASIVFVLMTGVLLYETGANTVNIVGFVAFGVLVLVLFVKELRDMPLPLHRAVVLEMQVPTNYSYILYETMLFVRKPGQAFYHLYIHDPNDFTNTGHTHSVSPVHDPKRGS